MEDCSPRERWLQELESDDEGRVVSALHAACPCTGDSELYETFMVLLARFKKDPRPRVRRTALHLERDALEQLAIEDERANGFVRNRPGGDGRRGETRRPDVRHGLS